MPLEQRKCKSSRPGVFLKTGALKIDDNTKENTHDELHFE